MIKSFLNPIIFAAGVVAISGSVYAQDTKKAPAKGPTPAPAAVAPAAAAAAPAKSAGGDLYPQSHFDVLLKERVASGQAPDSAQLREMRRRWHQSVSGSEHL